MTTSKQAKFHLNEKAFVQMANSPQVVEATKSAAEQIRDMVMATWPKSIGNDAAADTEKFKHILYHQVFVIMQHQWLDKRPVFYLLINHPYAVAHQARTGAITKSISASGYTLHTPKGG